MPDTATAVGIAAAAVETPITAPRSAPDPAPAPAPDAAAASGQPADQPAGPEAGSANARLLEQGRNLFVAGKVLEARKRFIAALNGLSPNATLALARTFDTYYLSRLPATDGAPDMQRAVQLYQSAVERGSVDARIDLERTRATLGLLPR